jgi:hypothetical protein
LKRQKASPSGIIPRGIFARVSKCRQVFAGKPKCLMPVMSKKCDVNEGLKDRCFGATEEDEDRPLDVGWQRQASNQAVRLELKRPRS